LPSPVDLLQVSVTKSAVGEAINEVAAANDICEPYSAVAGGTLVGKTGKADAGAAVAVMCNDGLVIAGSGVSSMIVICHGDGTWSNAFSCEKPAATTPLTTTATATTTTVGNWAFDGCSSLASISLPDSVTAVRKCAFAGCSRLSSISLPGSVTAVGDDTGRCEL